MLGRINFQMDHLKISETFSIIIYPKMSNIKLIVNRAYNH